MDKLTLKQIASSIYGVTVDGKHVTLTVREEAARREAEGPKHSEATEMKSSAEDCEREGLGSAAAENGNPSYEFLLAYWDKHRVAVDDYGNKNPAPFRLEVGKSYARRDGTGPVKVTDIDDDPCFPVNGSDGQCYKRDGRYYDNCGPRDLVSLWQAEVQAPKGDGWETVVDPETGHSQRVPPTSEAQAPQPTPAMQCAKCGPQGCDGACLGKAPQPDADDLVAKLEAAERAQTGTAWPRHLLYEARSHIEAQALTIQTERDARQALWVRVANMDAERDALKARVADAEREIARVRPKADCYDLVRARLGIENNIIGHVEGINARVARLEAHLMKAAIDLHAQVDVANKYAKDARPKEAREIPTVWEIQNSHFRDIARGIDAALAGDKANG